MDYNKEKADGIDKLIKAGSKIAGTSLGAAVGLSLAGTEGAVQGAAVGTTCSLLLEEGLTKVVGDFATRVLGPREVERIGASIIYARNKIQEKLAAGETLRNDGFFEQPQPPRSACAEIPIIERPPSEEIIEGILLSVQKEHEEKKLPFIGNLMANICFDSSIDKSQANFLIKIGKNISYMQMCILSMFSHPYKSNIEGRYFESSNFPYADRKLNSLFQEIFDLGSQGLLYRAKYEPVTKASDLNDPMSIEIVGAGSDLYRLMELGRLSELDLDPILFKLFPSESTKYPPKKRRSN